jgi:hypothetical protein
MVSNPMVEWHISKIPIITMALYMWDVFGYDPNQAYLFSIHQMVSKEKEMFESLKIFTDENYDSLIYAREDDIFKWIENG